MTLIWEIPIRKAVESTVRNKYLNDFALQNFSMLFCGEIVFFYNYIDGVMFAIIAKLYKAAICSNASLLYACDVYVKLIERVP